MDREIQNWLEEHSRISAMLYPEVENFIKLIRKPINPGLGPIIYMDRGFAHLESEYITPEQFKTIEEWEFNQPWQLLDYVHSLCDGHTTVHLENTDQPKVDAYFDTCGNRDNELLIRSLAMNSWFFTLYFHSHQTGGHWHFKIPLKTTEK